jgi:two-component system CheB/CheR fusion protein
MAAKRKAISRASPSRIKTSGTKSSRLKSSKTKSALQSANQYSSCPIVGIGGSAGGFEAAMELLRHLPPRTGMAFVIVQHLDPHHGSRLPNLLGKATSMLVTEITGTTVPKPNTVYVQPPDKCVIAKNGKLTLVQRTERLNLAIDHFFESLAEEYGSRAIGIVLSGTGSDGRERKVTDKEDREYSLRVRPYRTTDNKIDGAVLTLVDIDGTKEGDASKTENRTKNVSSRT